MRDLLALPKVELHVHLEGSMRVSTVVELAERYGVELPEGLREGRYGFRSFRHFIDEWLAGLSCLRSTEDVRRVALEFCADEAAQGVRYAEVSFSLPDHAERFEDWDGPIGHRAMPFRPRRVSSFRPMVDNRFRTGFLSSMARRT